MQHDTDVKMAGIVLCCVNKEKKKKRKLKDPNKQKVLNIREQVERRVRDNVTPESSEDTASSTS